MPAYRYEIVQRLWRGCEPFSGAVTHERVDHQGWASENILLKRAIDEKRPRLVAEVGVWKGGSVITFADRLRAYNLDSAVIAVDTWLGSSEHWLTPDWHDSLRVTGGYPTLYDTFAANVADKGLRDYVVPLPLDSLNAAKVFEHHGLRPEVMHIDGGHDYESVMADLRAWWPLVADGGVLIGDDYHPDGEVWPEVAAAFHDFFKVKAIAVEVAGKCWIDKPAQRTSLQPQGLRAA